MAAGSTGRSSTRYAYDRADSLVNEEVWGSSTMIRQTTYLPDDADRTEYVYYADGTNEHYTYYPDGTVKTVDTRDGLQLLYDYDEGNLLTDVIPPSQVPGTPTGALRLDGGDHYKYDIAGRPLMSQRKLASGQVAGEGQGGGLRSESAGSRGFMTWGYDLWGNPRLVELPQEWRVTLTTHLLAIAGCLTASVACSRSAPVSHR